MAFRWAITRAKLIELCERAVRYRRSFVTDPLVNPEDLRAHIRFGNPTGTREPDADGWVLISVLEDHFACRYFYVMWHETTDRVRLVDPDAGRRRWA